MDTIVPVLGLPALHTVPMLADRIVYTIHAFGHEHRFIDAGTVHSLYRIDPLKSKIPFLLLATNVEDQKAMDNWLLPVRRLFPNYCHIEGQPECLPTLIEYNKTFLSLGGAADANATVRRAVRIMYDRLDDEHLTIESVSYELAISEKTLERRFREWKSIMPKQFLIDIRMREGYRMVKETTNTITEIAYAVGYSLEEFDHRFHKTFGRSPSKVRTDAHKKS